MTKTLVRIIAALEMVGGVAGVGLVAWWLSAAPVNALTILLAPIPVGIYVLSLAAGVALWRGSPFGRRASIVVQLIQLPKLVSPQLIFMFSFGLDLWVHYLRSAEFANLGFEFRLLAFNQLFINAQGAPVGLGISVIAPLFLLVLIRYESDAASDVHTPPPPPVDWGGRPNDESSDGARPTAP
jgi:hypothetical protein